MQLPVEELPALRLGSTRVARHGSMGVDVIRNAAIVVLHVDHIGGT